MPQTTDTRHRFLLIALVILTCTTGRVPGCRHGSTGADIVAGDADFYHLVLEDGKWWFREPGGDVFVSLGINHIEPVLITSESNRHIFEKRYGNDLVGPDGVVNPLGEPAREWMEDSVELIQSWGFNTIGVHNPIPQERLPYVARFRPYPMDGWSGLSRVYPDPFDEGVEEHVKAEARDWCDLNAQDELILGISFNDMPIFHISLDGTHEWVSTIMGKDGQSPGKKRWIQVLKQRHESARKAAEVYGVPDSTWEDLQARTQWPARPERPWLAYQDSREFLPVLVGRWYAVITGAISDCDPHHLILGDKLEGTRDMPTWLDPLVGKYFDAAFIQWYEYADRQVPRLMELHAVTGEPVLMGDSTFSFPSETIPRPKGIHVASRQDVGEAHAKYLERILAQPWVLGWHLCGFIDGSPDLASHHPYFSIQPGLLASNGTPHEATVRKVKQANQRAPDWHRSPSESAMAATRPGVVSDSRLQRCETQSRGLFKLSRIDNNVYSIGGFVRGAIKVPVKNVGWVITEEGVVVIDPGTRPHGHGGAGAHPTDHRTAHPIHHLHTPSRDPDPRRRGGPWTRDGDHRPGRHRAGVRHDLRVSRVQRSTEPHTVRSTQCRPGARPPLS